MKIILNNIEFYGYHGIHDLEKKVGLNFQVDATIEFSEKSIITALNQTIDYGAVFTIIKQEFNVTESLLETLIERIASAIKDSYPFISRISLRIIKKGAYIEGMKGDVGVEFTKNYIPDQLS
jgi:dihydroneopterin aldolase